MPSYSIAATKDNLSGLLNKALAGEEVIITRHGKPIAEINGLRGSRDVGANRVAAMQKLRAWQQESAPVLDGAIPYERFYDWLHEDED